MSAQRTINKENQSSGCRRYQLCDSFRAAASLSLFPQLGVPFDTVLHNSYSHFLTNRFNASLCGFGLDAFCFLATFPISDH